MNFASIAQSFNPARIERPTWQNCLLLAGLAWALVVVVPDFCRLNWNLASLGFSADNDGSIYAVDENGPASSQGLTTDDKIPLSHDSSVGLRAGACLPMNTQLCRDYLAVFGGMGGLAYVQNGTVIHLPVAGRNGTVTLTARTAPLDGLTKVLLLLDECAAVFVLFRAYNLVRSRMDTMTIGFFLYVMWFNPGQYFYFYAWLQPYPKWLLLQEACQALAQGAGYAGFLIFALRFPHNRTEAQFQNLEKLAIVAGGALAVLQLSSFANVFGYRTEVITRAAILGGYAVALYSFYIVWRRTKLQAPTDYQRMRWVLWGCALGIPAFIFADSNEATSLMARYVWSLAIWHEWSPSEWVFEASFLISGVLAIFICEAIRRPRIINVSIELRRFWAVVIAIISSAALEKVCEHPLDNWLTKKQMPGTVQWPAWAAVTVMGALASHKGVDWSRELMTGRLREAIEQLAKASTAAISANRTEDVDALLANAPVEAFHLTFAVALRPFDEGFRQVYPLVSGTAAAPFPPLTPNQLANLKMGQVVWIGSHRPISAEAALQTPTIAVPAIAGRRLEALLLCGPHDTGADIDSLEAEALNRFARDIAVGYETARANILQEENEALRRQLAEKSGPAS